MARIRAGPAALRLRRAAGGNQMSRSLSRPLSHPATRLSIGALRARCIATNAAIQEPDVDFPASVPPVSVPATSKVDERRKAIKNAKPFSDFLTDTFNRQHDYLRISITERCNLRCLYCMPEEGIPLSPPANMLTTPEIFYLSSLFVSQGVTKIRLTGGEPTVRRDIVPLMQQIGSLRPRGLRELALTTNGISLHRKLDAMVEAGLTGVNLSLDTLDPFQFQIMTRRKGFDAVMRSIDRILEMNKLGAKVKLKVNCVVMRGLNEREILPFVEMGREKDIEVRFIEYMPFGGNKWSENKMISFQEMLDTIRTKYPGLRPVPGHKNDTSKTYEVPGFVGKVGFITSMTNDFCGSCNRLRITSDGNLKVCLHGNAEVSLRDVLRQGNGGEPIDQEAFERIKQVEMDRHEGRLSDETVLGWGQRERELLDVVGAAVKRKAEKHADLDDLANMENRPMILIDDKPLSSLDSQWSTLRRQPPHHSNPLLPRSSTPTSPLPFLHTTSPPTTTTTTTTTTIRAFSTSPTPSAKKTYQLKRLAKAKKLLKNIDTSRSTDAFGVQQFLEDVEAPNESENLLRDIEKKIANLHRRIVEVERGTPLAPASASRVLDPPVSPVVPEVRVADTFDAVGTPIGNDATAPRKRKGKNERERARRREQERYRTEKMKELGVLLASYKQQAAVVKAEAEKTAEMRKRREQVLAKKRLLLQQLNAHEEGERRASLVRRTSMADREGALPEGFELDDVLDDAMKKVKKMPMHPPREEREYKERDVKDVDVPKAKRVVWPAGKGAVSVLKRGDEIVGDPIMERERDGAGDVGVTESTEEQAQTTTSESIDEPLVDEPVDMVADDFTSSVANAGDPFPPASVQQKPSTKASKPTNIITPRSPPSPPSSKDDLRLNIPPSGIIPIDSTLILSLDAPVPHLQSQVLALRNRLKSSYPRIDNLPYDVWTSSNKRTLQTWLKILISRWNARFDHVDGTGQVDKRIVDERVKEVLDSMVREHDLGNEAAERMAVRWHEAFERRGDMWGDAEGVLDWEEMEAGGLGFLGLETEEMDGEVPMLKQEMGETGEEVDGEKKIEPMPVRMAGSGVTTNGVMGRRMYSTSTRRGFWSWSKILGTDGKDEKNEKKEEVKQGPTVDAKPDSKTQPKPAATPNARPVVKTDAKTHEKTNIQSIAKPDVKPDPKRQPKRPAESVPPKPDDQSDAKAETKDDAKPDPKADTKDDAKPDPRKIREDSPRMHRPPGQGVSKTVLRNKRRQAKKMEDERRMTEVLERGREGGDEQMDVQEQGIEDEKRELGAHEHAGEFETKQPPQQPPQQPPTVERAIDELPQYRVESIKKVEEVLPKPVPRTHQIVPNQDADTDTDKPAFVRAKRPLQSLPGLRRSRHVEWRKLERTELPGPPRHIVKPPTDSKGKAPGTTSLQDFLDSMNEVAAHSPFEAEPRQQTRPLSMLEGEMEVPVQQPSSAQQPVSQTKPTPSQSQLQQSQLQQFQQQPSLPHLTPSGSAHMVSVSAKEHTTRTAIAVGSVYFTNAVPLRLIRSNANKKGDVLGTSRIAGIMAAKKCPDLIPLCHPIALTHVGVELRLFGDKGDPRTTTTTTTKEGEMEGIMGVLDGKGKDKMRKMGKMGFGGVNIEAKVQCTGPTGVEMEALTAVMGAALSVVDMCKAVDRAQRVSGVRVVMKEGGRSGGWREGGWRSWQE
ncbi:hypothetical protein J4E83_008998 [Alternaria metachromatica]|uniref:uncharacterized protein n=1 Tax=Alternaria metachromatica TaxID=283354 RepID=UPI0020C33501|nr:uncharacterized protein J4E83_008998 [Alternaria metachromatica]KAI4608562.1 hypothetical protein J4E83_008998 [Alternaria metachromatica]